MRNTVEEKTIIETIYDKCPCCDSHMSRTWFEYGGFRDNCHSCTFEGINATYHGFESAKKRLKIDNL